MDLHTGVSALQAVHHQPHTGAVNSSALNRQSDLTAAAAGAGHSKDTLILGVDVNESPASQVGQVDTLSSEHTRFLVHGDDHLQRRMGNILVSQQRQRISDSDTVIAAQRCTLGKHKLAVMGHIQAVGIHIDGAVGILFADHIHMPLQDNRRVILHTAGAIAENDHIIKFVLLIPQTVGLGKIHQKITDPFGIAGAMGDGADLLKVEKHGRRLQAGKLRKFHISSSIQQKKATEIHGLSLRLT